MHLDPPPSPGHAVPRPDPLPDRVEVAVVGAGPAGLAAATVLAEGGARVALLGPEAGWPPGSLHRIPDEPLVRLCDALGASRCRALCELHEAGVDALLDLGAASRSGGLHLAAMPGEAEDLRGAAELLEAWGRRVTWVDAPGPDVPPGALPALGFDDEATGHPDALALLAGAARRAGVRCCRAEAIAVPSGERVLTEGEATLRCELVVVAAGAATGRLLPALGDVVVPTRVQAIAWPEAATAAPVLRGQRGHLHGWVRADGLRVLSGCRWASPHLEMGERDPGVGRAAVDRALRARKEAWWPGAPPPVRRWAAIAAGSCDGLPVVGTLPGEARVLVLAGFGERAFELGVACGRLLGEALLHPEAAWPRWLSPGRFV